MRARDQQWRNGVIVGGNRLVSDMITEKLAECNPVVEVGGRGRCALCGSGAERRSAVDGRLLGVAHLVTCPWQMAWEYVRGIE